MATNITAITDSANKARPSSRRQFQAVFKEVIPFSFVGDDDSIAAQVAGQCDIAVPGAELGDFVLLVPGVDPAAQIMQAYVSAADVVTVTTFNVEGTDADTSFGSSPTFYGLVLKRNANFWP